MISQFLLALISFSPFHLMERSVGYTTIKGKKRYPESIKPGSHSKLKGQLHAGDHQHC